ncbi:MAG: tRNA pseudouridine(38-40) synthase TruA [Ilumatobacteraceae bacterium]|nr:tRNA pseudouridine(38-40) synthase TruA [Ilumatobacteraceae bacterium]
MNEETPGPAARRVRLVVAYNGEPFHGFAISAGVSTVAGTLADALRQITGHAVVLTGAGRTDAGVHGWGQVVTFDLPADREINRDLVRIAKSLNSMLEPHIVIRDAAWVAPDFDARFSALWRHYRYRVLNTPTGNPFEAATSWHVTTPLDLRAMQLASDAFIGEHDFSAFCRRPKLSGPSKDAPEPSMARRVISARWSDAGSGILHFEIRANAFCQQMVRSIVGTLVEVGMHRRRAGEMTGILRSGSRAMAGHIAPPHGLCLMEVGYPT